MSIGYLGALGSYTSTTLLREATVYTSPSTDADEIVVYPAGTVVAVEPLADRTGWMRLANVGATIGVYGFVQASAVNMPMASPSVPRAQAPAIGTATKVFAAGIGLAVAYLLVTR